MQQLSMMWSVVLSHTDEELGIDAEYTRPGTEALLNKFAESINEMLSQQECPLFKWDSYKAPDSGSKKRKNDSSSTDK